MKTTTLRILFTLAILAGLAAAPAAQTFRWQAGSQNDEARVRARAQVAVREAHRALERSYKQAERQLDLKLRAADRQVAMAERQANLDAQRIERQVRAQVNAQVRRQVRDEVRHSQGLYFNRGYYRGMNNVADYAGAQVGSDADPCRDNAIWRGGNDNYEQSCDVRESRIPAGALNVDAGQNGGIVVEGWDGNDIRVRAVVQGSARTASRAKEIASQVQVQAAG